MDLFWINVTTEYGELVESSCYTDLSAADTAFNAITAEYFEGLGPQRYVELRAGLDGPILREEQKY